MSGRWRGRARSRVEELDAMASRDAHRLEARASRRERMNARSLPRAKLAIVRAHAGPRWPFRSLPKTDATTGSAQFVRGTTTRREGGCADRSERAGEPAPSLRQRDRAGGTALAKRRRSPGTWSVAARLVETSVVRSSSPSSARRAECPMHDFSREVERRLPISGTRARDVSALRPARASRFGRRHDSAQDARRAPLASRRYER